MAADTAAGAKSASIGRREVGAVLEERENTSTSGYEQLSRSRTTLVTTLLTLSTATSYRGGLTSETWTQYLPSMARPTKVAGLFWI